MKHYVFPNLFQVTVADWAIPAIWVAMTSAFLLVLGYPIGSLVAGVLCGAAIWFGHSRAGTLVFFILLLAVGISIGFHIGL